MSITFPVVSGDMTSVVSGEFHMPEDVVMHHMLGAAAGQCGSVVVKTMDVPIDIVWSIVSCFAKPQVYKPFIKSCRLINGDGGVGSLREVEVVSGLPASSSVERLEILDDEKHVMSFRVVGGDHRLNKYQCVTTLHEGGGAGGGGNYGTVVVESYIVDVPEGNTAEDTSWFVDTIISCNLRSLAERARNLAATTGSADENLA